MKAYKWNRFFYSVGVIVLGAFLLLKPDASLTVVSQCIGVFLLAGGILSAVSAMRYRTLLTGLFLALSVVMLLLGIWILRNPYRLASLIPTLLGVFVMLSGALNIGEAVVLGRQHGRWVSSLIMGLITVGIGFWLINSAFGIASFVTRLGGAVLLYDGVTDLLIAARMKPIQSPQSMEPIDVESHEVITEKPEEPETAAGTGEAAEPLLLPEDSAGREE